jgi:hypothetical protein
LRSLVVAMAIFQKAREFVIFKIYIEKRDIMLDRTELGWLRHQRKSLGQSDLFSAYVLSVHP